MAIDIKTKERFSLIVEGFNTLKDFGFSLRQLSLHKLKLCSNKNYIQGYIVPIWLLSTYQVCIQTNIGAVRLYSYKVAALSLYSTAQRLWATFVSLGTYSISLATLPTY